MDDGDLQTLDAALLAVGVVNFTARELTYLRKAKPPKCVVPEGQLFTNLIRVAILAQLIRTEVAAPLIVSSAFRPEWYNTAVGGASNSAHIRAAAIDLNALSNEAATRLKEVAEKWWNLRDHPVFSVVEFAGLGFYENAPRRVHIDVVHPRGKGHRRWTK